MSTSAMTIQDSKATPNGIQYPTSGGNNYNVVRDAVTGESFQAAVKQLYINELYYICRAFSYFDLTGVTQQQINRIVSAKLHLHVNRQNIDSSQYLRIQSGMPNYPSASLQLSDYNRTYYSGNGGQIAWTDIPSGSFLPAIEIDFSASGLTWLTAGVINKFCLRLTDDIDGVAPDSYDNILLYNDFSGTEGDRYTKLILTIAGHEVETWPATNVQRTSATLNGYLNNDGGEATVVGFEWGTTTDYGTTTATESKTTGDEFSCAISGLTAGTTYHFRALATNVDGTVYGIDRTFVFQESGPAKPSLYLELAFGQSIFTESPIWTDVSADLMELDTNRGRMHELDRIEAGTAAFTLNNAEGRWWRNNTASDFYPDVKPLTLIRLRAKYDVTFYPLWYGVTESFQHKWLDEAGYGPIVELSCVDIFKTFARFNISQNMLTTNANSGQKNVAVTDASKYSAGQSIYIADTAANESNIIDSISDNTLTMTINLTHSYTTARGAYVSYGSELSGARIGHVFDSLGWPAALRTLDAGVNIVAPLLLEVGGINAMNHLYQVARDEDGIIFQGADGKVVFQDSLARQTDIYFKTSQATFNDDDTNSKYVLPELIDDETYIWNGASFSPDKSVIPAWTEVILADGVAQASQGPRIYTIKDSLLTDQGAAFDQALIKILRYNDSKLRCQNLLIFPDASPANLYPIVFSATDGKFDISTRITLNLNSIRNPAILSQQYHIEGIHHHWSMISDPRDRWETQYQLWDVNQYRIGHSTGDGYVVKEDAVYLTAHDAVNADTAYNDDAGGVAVGQLNNGTGISNDFLIWRGFLSIDTNIGSLSITSASLFVYVTGHFVIDNAFDLTIVPPDAVHLPLDVADYGNLEGQIIDWGHLTISAGDIYAGLLEIPLNATGIANIPTDGYFKFGFRSSRDISSTSPGTPGPLQEYLAVKGYNSDFSPRLLMRIT